MQYQGKEMRNLGSIVLGALAIALQTPTAVQRIVFRNAL